MFRFENLRTTLQGQLNCSFDPSAIHLYSVTSNQATVLCPYWLTHLLLFRRLARSRGSFVFTTGGPQTLSCIEVKTYLPTGGPHLELGG